MNKPFSRGVCEVSWERLSFNALQPGLLRTKLLTKYAEQLTIRIMVIKIAATLYYCLESVSKCWLGVQRFIHLVSCQPHCHPCGHPLLPTGMQGPAGHPYLAQGHRAGELGSRDSHTPDCKAEGHPPCLRVFIENPVICVNMLKI